MDYNKLFAQDAFKNINKDVLENFKVLANNIKGKSTNEAILHIMNFYNSIPKNVQMTKEEREALMKAIVLNLDDKERKNFLNMLDLISNLTNN